MLDLWDSGLKIAGGKWTMSGQDDHLSGWNFHFQSFWPDLSINRELNQWQRRWQKSNMRRLEKQLLCTWITLFSTFLGHCCTTMTWTFLISHFVEDGNTTQQLSFSFPELSYSPLQFNSRKICQHLTNCTRWNKRKKVWGSPNSLFKWCFRSCCWCCCLNSLKEKLHFYTITFQEDKHLFFALCFCLLGWYIQFTIGLFLTFWPVGRKTWPS